jgi:ATP-binding cassette, subfamily A (ABC1), member 3
LKYYGTAADEPHVIGALSLRSAAEPFKNPLLLVNNTYLHSYVPLLSAIHEAEARSMDLQGSIEITTHPFSMTAREVDQIMRSPALAFPLFSRELWALGVVLVVPLYFIAYENEHSIRSQLFLSGCGVGAYWFGNLFFDSVLLSISIALVILMYHQNTGFEAFFEPKYVGAFVGLHFLAMYASVIWNYLTVFVIRNSQTAVGVSVGLNTVAAVIGTYALFVLGIIPNETVYEVYQIVQVLRIWPLVNLGDALLKLIAIRATWKNLDPETRTASQQADLDEQVRKYKIPFYMNATSVWDYDVVGANLQFFIITTLGGLFTLYIMDRIDQQPNWKWPLMRLCRRRPQPMPFQLTCDEDVENAKKETREMSPETMESKGLVVKNVSKVWQYKSVAKNGMCCKQCTYCECCCFCCKAVQTNDTFVHATQDVSFTLDAGSCFGMLGANGAGKSTLFGMMCGIAVPEPPRQKGETDILVNGTSIITHVTRTRRSVGYTPQYNPIWEDLTVRDHLRIYATCKGLRLASQEKELQIISMMKDMALLFYENVPAGKLSGGNKRKLVMACALLGRPKMMYLDEPSAGMDPKARRVMWNIIKSSTANLNSTCILTTHSMDECEALCNKVAIMANGRMRCFAPQNVIRHRYGGGFDVVIYFKPQDTFANHMGAMLTPENAVVYKFNDALKVFHNFYLSI